ncbi:diguanylate cyclase (GGDEF)-like protein/PAS domain S-box-containing protein [Fontibacillus solani]|uniref:Diguanylate cyclase (GGDEF)-like protein/PAS domain S-box-containing protein n=1 Tax=Fontibacillus solani TaxID=1572857 RepID=A0A7W3XPP9_9BACL|nr:bifunctional diguanylate cyclase/phosphodiesterase [Fontibacillus solani]MBA9083688.1 diguanylate cyclase (GGDEF)-like protein/PAS domain S-box-containing protein [Fontibacillus solani]
MDIEKEQKINTTRIESIINSSALLRSIDMMGVGMAITNPNIKDNPLVYVNQGFEQITGYSRDEVLMRNCRFLQGEETDMEHLGVIRQAIKEGRADTVTIKNYKKDGSTFWNQFIISPIMNEEGKPSYFIGLQFDVTREMEERDASNQRIRQLSYFDPITGLLNMSRFREVMKAELITTEAEKKTAAVLRVNINRFRYINESYGEGAGNDLLKSVADRMRETFDEGTPICRSFADEFIVLLSRLSDPLQIHKMASDLSESLNKPYILFGEEITIGFGTGISIYPDDGPEATLLLKHAELAMKEAKTESLHDPHYFDYYLMDKLLERVQIEKKLPRALAEGEFELFYQPKINLETRTLTGLEALIRWNDPEKGRISPAAFIPIAEDSGFIVQLGEWVLREACRTNKMWQDAGHPKLPVSVNVSAIQFRHPQFVKTVESALQETGLDPKYLELEVTESLLNEPVMIKDKLDFLKSRGISLSIDDFGTGYSSIYYLKELPLQVLKIDRTFIQNTPTSTRDNSLLLSIIQLGKSLGLTVLAEGVETEEQFHFLRQHGCDQIQGFYFSRPLDSCSTAQLLAAHSD